MRTRRRLTTGFATALLHVIGIASLTGAEERKWGTDISATECAAQGGPQRLQDILSGKLDSYAFNGPSEDCDVDGCKHPHWGPRARWTGKEGPACPAETRMELQRMLKEYANNGAKWAADALSLQPCEMWEAVKGRTIWFAGDSTSQESAHAFLCFLVEYMETSMPAPRITTDKHLMHRLTHNANNAELTTWCGLFKEHTRVCMLRVNFGPRMASVLLPALTQITDPQDIVVLNFGLWSNSMEELKMHASIFETAFEFHRDRLPNRTFWRETTAQHYSTPNGMYDTNMLISEQECRPVFPGANLTIAANGSLIVMPESPMPEQFSPDEWELQRVMEGGPRNLATQPAIDRLGLHTIRSWNTSMAMWMFHHDVHMKDEPSTCAKVNCDCTHSCQPSWQQLWLPDFLRAFTDSSLFMAGGKADGRAGSPDHARMRAASH